MSLAVVAKHPFGSVAFLSTQPPNPMSTAHTPELLPCPFCGGRPEVVMTHRDHWIVQCLDCGIQQDDPSLNDSGAGAIVAWNSRAPSPVNVALLEALQGFLDRHQNEADGAGSKECECFECHTARATLTSATS